MTGQPLLSRRAEAGLLVAAAAVGVAILGFHYAGNRRAGRLDTAIDNRLQAHLHEHLLTLRRLITVGDPAVVVFLGICLVVAFLVLRKPRLALLAAAGPAAAAILSEYVLKPLIGRHIRESLSFPSGHTTGVVALAIVVAVAMLGPQHPPWPLPARWVICAVALAGAGAVATALVGAGYHYATDILGGACVAVAVVLSAAMLIDWAAAHRRLRR